MPPRHIPRPTSLRTPLRAERRGCTRWLPEPCPAATGGCGFTIETGSESAIGITQPLSGSFSRALRAMAPLQRPVLAAERQSTQILSAPLAAAAKGAPEPTVEIRYQGTGWDRLFAQFGIVNYRCRDRVVHAERQCAGVCSLTRGNLAARHADGARLVDESGKKGWQRLDGPQRGQVHPGLIWPNAVGARPSSLERTWPHSFLGCRRATGPCRSPSRWDGKMRVKWPKKGAKWRLLREHATLLFMTQLLYCQAVALIVVEKSDERQIATTIYSLRTCVENMVSQIFKKAQKRSISQHITHAKRTQVQIAPGGEIAALARPEADSETSLARRGSAMVQLPDLRG